MEDHATARQKPIVPAFFKELVVVPFTIIALLAPLFAQSNGGGHGHFRNVPFALVREKSKPVIQSQVWKVVAEKSSEEPVVVWVFFTDKGISSEKDYERACIETEETMTDRAQQRRQKVHSRIDFADLPVSKDYVRAVMALDVTHRATSKWFNAISVAVRSSQLEEIANLPFVRELQLVSRAKREPLRVQEKMNTAPTMGQTHRLDYGPSQGQLEQINVPAVHELGRTGAGVIILMLDTGFQLNHDAFQNLSLISQYDFINKDSITADEPGDPPGQHDHGTATLSAVGGASPGHLYGPAYGADFLLAKTEDVSSETPVEEDYWVAAIEWGDSIGADVASSSLIYLDWYEYEDMDGNTATITRAADLAAARGILVCNSAGNERDSEWHYIAAPADADSILACGAVDENGEIAFFSSSGPTYDGQIKPEVAARGYYAYVAESTNPHRYYDAIGTSYAAPLIAGAAALVLEAHPEWTPMQVREALMMTADRASAPDNLYGWGIVDVLAAINYQSSPVKGDVDGDGAVTLVDVIVAVNFILGLAQPGPGQMWAADCIDDGFLNVLDVICIANIILSPPARPQ